METISEEIGKPDVIFLIAMVLLIISTIFSIYNLLISGLVLVTIVGILIYRFYTDNNRGRVMGAIVILNTVLIIVPVAYLLSLFVTPNFSSRPLLSIIAFLISMIVSLFLLLLLSSIMSMYIFDYLGWESPDIN